MVTIDLPNIQQEGSLISLIRFTILIVLSSLYLSGCSFSPSFLESSDPEPINNHSTSSIETTEKKPLNLNSRISISAVGDVLIHERVYQKAKTSEGYNFMPMLEETKPTLESSTISIANQETMIGGKDLGLSGYPTFNSPKEIGDNLKSLGIDVVTLANNHTLDKGVTGIEKALNHWNKIDMKHTGAYTDKKQSEEILVYETKENLDVAVLSYTYGTNGIPSPEGKEYVVNRINYDKMAKDISEAKKLADAVIVSLHFGNEYQLYPSPYQKDVVQFAADQEVDAVLGHHPHVLQPIKYVEGKNGNRMLTIYSLGNFFSGQLGEHKRIGGIFAFDFVKKADNKDVVQAVDPRFQITYVTSDYQVVPMADIPVLSDEYKAKKEHMSQWLPELTFIE
ncbi:CapA family protein [Halobacillus mangrovi]|uniref:CapA family protein n=1 Tax=Halobacillus mangrovi TaxID=402384 RepID=UPI003D9771D5